jgi:hypothetical protein
MKIIIKALNKEKSDLEELILKQETKVSDLAAKIKNVEKNMREKNKEIKDNEENYLKLIDIIEEQKKEIEIFNKTNKDKEIGNDIDTPNMININKNNYSKEEFQLIKQIAEKDKDISTLKIFNENLKMDVQGIKKIYLTLFYFI